MYKAPKKIAYAFFVLIFGLQIFIPTVSAATLTPTQKEKAQEGLVYYNPNSCSDGASSTASTSTTSLNTAVTVNTTNVTYTDTSRGGRQVSATLYIPSNGTAHPLIMFAPGRFQNSTPTGFYARYLNAIAQQGFVVAGADFSDNSTFGAIPADATDIKFLITQIEADSKFKANINTTNGVGLIGHSDGGMIAMLDGYAAGFSDPSITAVMAEDGAWYPGYNQSSGPPLLLMHGSDDQIQNISSLQALYGSIQAPYVGFATVLGADHYHYIIDTTSKYIPVVDGLTTAFFTRALDGDTSSSTSLTSIAQQNPSLVSFQEHGNESAIAGKTDVGSSSSTQCCGASVSGSSQGGPLLDVQFPQLSDVGAMATNIDNYIKSASPSSPLNGMGATFVAAGQKYGVNPALMVAIAVKESSLGIEVPPGSHDAWGLNDPGDVSGYPFDEVYDFPSWMVGIYVASKYVGDNYAAPGSEFFSTTILQLMNHYTPDTKSQPNEAQEQTQVTLGVMTKIVAGLSVQGGSTTPAATTTAASTPAPTSSCGSTGSTAGLTNPFPKGWEPGRLDMGYDGHFTDEIVAPCAGNIIYDYADADHDSNGGWEGAYFVLQCSQQPSGMPANTSFYFAEGVQPTVSLGQNIPSAGQQIAVPGWTGYTEGPGGIEWGLALTNNPRKTYAESLGNSCTVGSASQKMVMNFSQWVQQNLNVAPPSSTNHAGCA